MVYMAFNVMMYGVDEEFLKMIFGGFDSMTEFSVYDLGGYRVLKN